MRKAHYIRHLSGLLLFSLALIQPAAQISSVAADFRDSLTYPKSGEKIPLFVFYQHNGEHRPGSLSASLNDGAAYSFEWSLFNPDSMGYDLPFHTDIDVNTSSVRDLENGGYQVRIFNGTDVDTTFASWLWLDRLYAQVNKDAEGNLPKIQRTCRFLYLMGDIEADTLIYYDPEIDSPLALAVKAGFKWTSDNPDHRIPPPLKPLEPLNPLTHTYDPPYEDTWYFLTVSDSLGMVAVDSVFYESIQTKADYSLAYWDKIRSRAHFESTRQDTFFTDLSSDFDPDFKQAPTDATLRVQFRNHSKNGAEFHWTFLDTLGGVKETIITYDTLSRPDFTYENANKYYTTSLLSISEEGCEDSVQMVDKIYVEPSELKIPNFFAPGTSGEKNQVWRFKHKSLKACDITVLDRTGKVVYSEEIHDIYGWNGWDGTIQNKGKVHVRPGQYYYIIEAHGYDGKAYVTPSVWSQMKIFGGAGTDAGSSGSQTDPGDGSGSQEQARYTGWLYLFRN